MAERRPPDLPARTLPAPLGKLVAVPLPAPKRARKRKAQAADMPVIVRAGKKAPR